MCDRERVMNYSSALWAFGFRLCPSSKVHSAGINYAALIGTTANFRHADPCEPRRQKFQHIRRTKGCDFLLLRGGKKKKSLVHGDVAKLFASSSSVVRREGGGVTLGFCRAFGSEPREDSCWVWERHEWAEERRKGKWWESGIRIQTVCSLLRWKLNRMKKLKEGKFFNRLRCLPLSGGDGVGVKR